MKLKVYEYDKCATCRSALKWLDKNKIAYEKVPIVERPPSRAELARMLAVVGDLKKLFNTSGLVYRETKAGDGDSPKPTDMVRVHYRGTFADGKEFDSSYKRGQLATFTLDQVIPCWTEGLQRMPAAARA